MELKEQKRTNANWRNGILFHKPLFHMNFRCFSIETPLDLGLEMKYTEGMTDQEYQIPALTQKISDLSLVAFDTETSGAYPVGSDIVEYGAVKYRQGQIVGRQQFLFKPRELMSDFIIKIHGITNEMVQDAPSISEKINEIHEFMRGSVLLAHHAPFDLGFLAFEFEKAKLPFPETINLCSSLLARKLIPESGNHKLQTLVKFLNIDGGSAHRAFDDAQACFHVGLECFRRLGPESLLEKACSTQQKPLAWENYIILGHQHPVTPKVVEAIQLKKDLEIVYDKGSHQGQVRRVKPWGIVRNPDGDYLMALCRIDNVNKRFYLSSISQVKLV